MKQQLNAGKADLNDNVGLRVVTLRPVQRHPLTEIRSVTYVRLFGAESIVVDIFSQNKLRYFKLHCANFYLTAVEYFIRSRIYRQSGQWSGIVEEFP